MSLPIAAEPAVNSDISESLAELIRTLESSDHVDAARAAALLVELDVDTEDLRPWHNVDHPVCDSYGRLLLCGGANFELMVMSWAPGDYSAIHDHGVAEWGAVRYFGAADHIVFEESDGLLSLKQRLTMHVDDVYAVDRSLIHLMGNPTDRAFVSLHLYGRTQAADSITGSARIFDLYEHKIQRTDGGVFFCLPESNIKRREPCPEAEPPIRLLHHQLMLARLERMTESTKLDSGLTTRIRELREEIDALSGQDLEWPGS